MGVAGSPNSSTCRCRRITPRALNVPLRRRAPSFLQQGEAIRVCAAPSAAQRGKDAFFLEGQKRAFCSARRTAYKAGRSAFVCFSAAYRLDGILSHRPRSSHRAFCGSLPGNARSQSALGHRVWRACKAQRICLSTLKSGISKVCRAKQRRTKTTRRTIVHPL